MTKTKNILFFNEIDKHDLPKVGGKGANLGEMVKAGFPVPNGFAVTVAAFDIFVDENSLNREIFSLLKTLDVNKPDQLNSISGRIRNKIKKSKIPKVVSDDTIKAYKKLI